MSRTDLWTRAALAMREDGDPRWHAVADWLRSEAACQDEMESFVELLNVSIEQTSGVRGYLRFGRKPDGDVSFLADTNEGATAVATAYLDTHPAPAFDESQNPTENPTQNPAEDDEVDGLARIIADHQYGGVDGDYDMAPKFGRFIQCTGGGCEWEQNIEGMSGHASWVLAHAGHVAERVQAHLSA